MLPSSLEGTVPELQRAYLITVGVISAQKKMLKLLTAWEENMPMMEKAMEKFLFSVPELSVDNTATHTHTDGDYSFIRGTPMVQKHYKNCHMYTQLKTHFYIISNMLPPERV